MVVRLFLQFCLQLHFVFIRHCFNDKIVSSITYDDIRKTYGGGPTRTAGYFASAYTSSTNAYMLMYRQVIELNVKIYGFAHSLIAH